MGYKDERTALFALGANDSQNADDLIARLRSALNVMSGPDLVLMQISRFYRTPCFPAGAGPDFVNAAASFRTRLPARTLLTRAHEVEAQFGRERVERWGQRSLDIDLIALGDELLPDPESHASWVNLPLEDQKKNAPDQLILPHPRMQDRGFVLVPLTDIAPDWVHPVIGLSIEELRAARPVAELAEIVALEG